MIFTCSCGKKLRIPEEKIGKKIRCPSCQEVQLVAAEGNDGEPARRRAEDVQELSDPRKRPPSKAAKTARRNRDDVDVEDNDDEGDDDDDRPRKKKKRKQPKASLFNARNLIGGGVLLGCLIALVIVLIVRFSPSADDKTAKGKPAPVPPVRKVSLGNGNPEFEKMASRLIGQWVDSVAGNTTYDYRSDGTFTLFVKNPAATVTGTWKVVGVGLDSAKLRRDGSVPAADFFKPNDSPIVYFVGDDQLKHTDSAGTVTIPFRRASVDPKIAKPPLEKPNAIVETSAVALGTQTLDKGPDAMDRLYAGKRVRVTGKVESVLDEIVYLETGLRHKEGQPVKIAMYFGDKSETRSVKHGASVVIEGNYNLTGVFGPGFKGCRLISTSN